MFGGKIFASSLLLTTFSSSLKKKAECAEASKENAAAEQGVQDLDKIFGATEGGIPPDPEEI